jgi:polyvinyl alcohol dehydrogenase (cytochrome)
MAVWHSKWHGIRVAVVLGVSLVVLSLIAVTFPTAFAASGDWTTFLSSDARSGFNASETVITPTSAPNLKLKWTHHAGGAITTQPIEANNLVYWGSWDGFEHATNLSNGFVWGTYVGQTTSPCGATAPFGPISPALSSTIGVASTSTVASINGRSMLFVGGGAAVFYALDALTGKVLWNRSLGSSSNHFIWSSPAVYNGNVYIGVASIGDCPLEQGQLIEMSAATGMVEHTFNVVPNGCIGAGVSGSPTIDEAAGTLYFATGNPGSCSSAEPYAESLIELNTSDLSFVHHWQVPASEATGDGDFISTPTLFTATINGILHNRVGVANKNGKFYAFERANIASGPIWKVILAVPGACPQCGEGSISPAAWDGTTLYAAGGNTTLNGVACKGSVRALVPATGHTLWAHCMFGGPVLGAVTAVPGVIVVGQGAYIIVINAVTGNTIFRFLDTSGLSIFGGASISHGVLYQGNEDGNLFAFAP